MELSVPLQLALITVVAFVCQWASWRIKLPAILPLLLSGLLLGSVAGLIQPKQLFGDLLLPGVSLAVSIILFEGALTLRFSEIRGLEKTVRWYLDNEDWCKRVRDGSYRGTRLGLTERTKAGGRG